MAKSYFFPSGENPDKEALDLLLAEMRKLGASTSRSISLLEKQVPTRMMDSSELSDRLGHLRRLGVDVPVLGHSEYKPVYQKTDEEGNELYSHAGRTIIVRAGWVIDDHGNVVPLGLLESLATRIRRKDEGNKTYADRLRELLSPNQDNCPAEDKGYARLLDSIINLRFEGNNPSRLITLYGNKADNRPRY